MVSLQTGLIIISLLLAPIMAATNQCECGEKYKIAGPSFKVRGRLSFWNGNPSRRIWVVGTKRIIGIRESTQLPANLKELITCFDDEIYGDFILCPLTARKNGVMQIACVQAADNLVKRKRD